MGSRRSINQSDYEHLLGLIYDATLNPSLWTTFLQQLTQSMGTAAATLRSQDIKANRVLFHATYNQDPDSVALYRERFIYEDPIIEALKVLPEGMITTTQKDLFNKDIARLNIMTPESYKTSSYYNEYIRPHDRRELAGGFVINNKRHAVLLGTQRANSVDPYFTQENLDFLQSLVPHLQRAMKISRHIIDLEEKARSTSITLDYLPMGVVIVDMEGLPLHCNKKAEALSLGFDGIAISTQGITTALGSESETLDKIIKTACLGGQSDGIRISGTMSIISPRHPAPLSVLVSPLGDVSSKILIDSPLAAAVVYIGFPENTVDPSESILKGLYGLSKSEARLVKHLVKGLTLDEAAAQIGVTINTVRTQLRAAFQKTGTDRQAALISSILSGPASLHL